MMHILDTRQKNKNQIKKQNIVMNMNYCAHITVGTLAKIGNRSNRRSYKEN